MNIVIGILLLLWCAFLFIPVVMSPMMFVRCDAIGRERPLPLRICVFALRSEFVLSAITSVFFFFDFPFKFILLGIALSLIATFWISFYIGSRKD